MKDIQDSDKLKQAREKKLQKALENLVNDPVQFLRRTQYMLGHHEAEYSVNWIDIYRMAQVTFMENALE